MNFNEADTRAKLIDPAIHKRGWTEDLIRREETAAVAKARAATETQLERSTPYRQRCRAGRSMESSERNRQP
jgi:type I site-specific restriction endonuclease